MGNWGDEVADYDAIKESVSIVEVIAPFVQVPETMKPVFYTRCPIHKGDSKTAFMVDTRTNSWFCFRCEKGGSVLDFVMATMGCSLREAAALLSDGRVIVRPSAMETLAHNTFGRMKAWQARKEDPPPLGDEYVPETHPLSPGYRGLSAAAIERYGLRNIPGEGWGTGTFIPFRDHNGVRIGYAIRHPEGVKPKYLNSRGLARGSALYGFWESKEDIAKADVAILVEGQFDAISLWDRGFRNVAALMGKQLTQKQATMLMAYCHKLFVMLDGDEAGQEAAMKIAKDWRQVFDIMIVSIPGDPDEVPVEELERILGVAANV